MSKLLILSGGGLHGAYQVPIISYLLETHDYDLVAGTSIGAVNGVLAAAGKISAMWAQWEAIDGILDVFKPSLFDRDAALADITILEDKLKDTVRLKDLETRYMCVITSLNTGTRFHIYDSDCKKSTKLYRSIRASSTLPGIAPPVKLKIGNKYHQCIDGGVIETIPVPLGEKDVQRIDVISTHDWKEIRGARRQVAPKRLSGVMRRELSIMRNETAKNDVEALRASYPNAEIFVYYPGRDLGSPASAKPEDIEKRFVIGERACKHPLNIK